jgi:hypothetical protein
MKNRHIAHRNWNYSKTGVRSQEPVARRQELKCRTCRIRENVFRFWIFFELLAPGPWLLTPDSCLEDLQ